MEIKYKQFVIVPKRPKMSKGKIASQVAHSTFMALQNQSSFQEAKAPNPDGVSLINNWKCNGMCVIVLQCHSPLELIGIAKYLKQWEVPHHLYIDEGLTEVDMGTATSLATGIMTEAQFWMFQTMGLFK